MIQTQMAHTLLMRWTKLWLNGGERDEEFFFFGGGGGAVGGSVWRWLCMAMAMYDKKLHVVVVARLSRGSETQERGGENLTV